MSALVVVSGRPWNGPANGGNSWVIVDGEKVGILAPNGRFSANVREGVHSVRIRQLWYSSPNVKFEFKQDSQTVLEADFAADGVSRFITGLTKPARFFRLTQIERADAPTAPTVDSRPYQRLTIACAIVVIVGVVTALLDPNAGWSEILGIGSLIFGIVGSITLSLLLRRKRSRL